MVWNAINTKKDKEPTAAEEIYYDIRKMILSEELKPNDVLPSESELSVHYGRSRPVVREAIRMLTRAGLAKTQPGIKGAVITVPSIETASEFVTNLIVLSDIKNEDFREFKYAFDPAMMRLAALHRNEKDLEKIKNDIEAIEKEMDIDGDYLPIINQFYFDIAEATKNKTFILINHLFRKAFFERAHRSSNRDAIKEYKTLYSLIKEQKAEEVYKEFQDFGNRVQKQHRKSK